MHCKQRLSASSNRGQDHFLVLLSFHSLNNNLALSQRARVKGGGARNYIVKRRTKTRLALLFVFNLLLFYKVPKISEILQVFHVKSTLLILTFQHFLNNHDPRLHELINLERKYPKACTVKKSCSSTEKCIQESCSWFQFSQIVVKQNQSRHEYYFQHSIIE